MKIKWIILLVLILIRGVLEFVEPSGLQSVLLVPIAIGAIVIGLGGVKWNT